MSLDNKIYCKSRNFTSLGYINNKYNPTLSWDYKNFENNQELYNILIYNYISKLIYENTPKYNLFIENFKPSKIFENYDNKNIFKFNFKVKNLYIVGCGYPAITTNPDINFCIGGSINKKSCKSSLINEISEELSPSLVQKLTIFDSKIFYNKLICLSLYNPVKTNMELTKKVKKDFNFFDKIHNSNKKIKSFILIPKKYITNFMEQLDFFRFTNNIKYFTNKSCNVYGNDKISCIYLFPSKVIHKLNISWSPNIFI